MNKYFNESIFKQLNITEEKEELYDLEKLTNIEIELLITNPVVGQTANGNSIYRPVIQDFKENQEMIFAGCSQTHGDHICPPLAKDGSHEQIWGFVVARKMNLDAINLGVGAEGIYRITQRLFAHFAAYGNPKTLLCLFPDPYRFTSPKDKENLTANFHSETFEFLQGTFHGKQDVESLPVFSKKPYKKEDVIPRMLPLFFNMQALSMLEQYCKSSNINFLWGSWDPNTNRIVKAMKMHNSKSFSGFIDLDKGSVDWKTTDCHKDIYDKYPKLYSVGIDGQHIGMHRHAHIAENFIEELQKLTI